MNGKIVGGVILVAAAIAGITLYYLQVYGYYREAPTPPQGVELVSLSTDMPEPILTDNFRAIDADSSPIRYRACFDTTLSLAMLSETYVVSDEIEPRNAPGWFDCFDAKAIGEELEAGTALTFLSQKNIHFGVDRIVAITSDGRGYIWHELNDCGEKSYDGTVVGEACPDQPSR
ncbi:MULTISPECIES: DUF6446 family protein [unclassified Sulfitobacter]|jgi:hypothetical protein|uniref:DUF6446 family protein n=1 Tax=unclassified Sulfitobacter TaxID=196795 RepID=UPI0015942F6C|nr:DUF6446 family protein [Sulfitobacter sp. HGT1]MBQ0805096.1 histidine kinase [Sulfitobacter sp.]